MHILILGAAGMIGRKLTERLLREGRLGKREIARLTLHDVVTPSAGSAPFTVEVETGDFVGVEAAAALVASRPDVIFHLAAVVSGGAEADLDKGYRINLDGTRHLLEAIRAIGGSYRPRLVFSSPIAVYGAPFPASTRGGRHDRRHRQRLAAEFRRPPRNRAGFAAAEKTFADIHIEDELHGTFVH